MFCPYADCIYSMLCRKQEDSGDLVRVFKGGIFDSSQPVRFTTSTFVVANEQVQFKKPFKTLVLDTANIAR